MREHPITYAKLPVLGQVAAGASVEFLPTLKFREVRLPEWATPADRFVLSEVCGDSLAEAGIFDGDFALIHLNSDSLTDGDLVAALTPDGFLIKFLWHEHDGQVRLESANPNRPPRHYDPQDVTIQGKVIRTERDR